jgi:hypothetical protein
MSISGVQHDFGGRGGGRRRKAKYLLFLFMQYIPCSEISEEKQKFFFFQPIK